MSPDAETAPRLHRTVALRLAGLGRALVDLALPPACMGCGRPVARTGALCAACWGALRLIERPFCQRLAIPFGYDIGAHALSAEAIADPPPFDRLRAVAVYDTLSGKIVQGLKYHDRTELAAPIGQMMARAAAEFAGDVELIVPVPLHRRRLWRRRFNQSAMIGQAIAAAFGKPLSTDALVRLKATRRQVGLKPAERAANVQGAFRVPVAARPAVTGRHVLLVDDVYTTGATVKAATRALLRGGAKTVDVVVFARVVEGSY
ncbi:ComF family protein [Kaistia dalseonensis]|uniref:ComF family protein n=1 Tax=Kaistia dalseonensis TaxID=410840 RepID=A0ABU0H5T6_9HYPH|nr:ComF family protein [Kaistia dalseonensis]MCX5494293.1 ComF family protein [Kaistia dalseonensis]MDQ0436874.1 ComF family protein [Kaistia dalseonensis]